MSTDTKHKWRVSIHKGYYDIDFEFDAFIDASCFICDAATHGEEGAYVSVERIKIEDDKEEGEE